MDIDMSVQGRRTVRRFRVAAVNPRREHDSATVGIVEDDGTVGCPVGRRRRPGRKALVAKGFRSGVYRCRVCEIEDQLVHRTSWFVEVMRSHNFHLRPGVREAEDGAVLTEASGEIADDRQSDEVTVEGNRGLVVAAGSGPP